MTNSKKLDGLLSGRKKVCLSHTVRSRFLDSVLLSPYILLATAIGSKTYLLRSILDPRLIEQANKPDVEILEEESVLDFGSGDIYGGAGGSGVNGDLLDDDDDWDDNVELHPRTYGSILSWSQHDQLSALGILYVILALILVNGKVVQERMCDCLT